MYFKIIMARSVTTYHQTCKTKTTAYKTKTDFLVSDRSCHKTDGLRPHHWLWMRGTMICRAIHQLHHTTRKEAVSVTEMVSAEIVLHCVRPLFSVIIDCKKITVSVHTVSHPVWALGL